MVMCEYTWEERVQQHRVVREWTFTGQGRMLATIEGGDFTVTDLPSGLLHILTSLMPAGNAWSGSSATYSQLIEARQTLDLLVLQALDNHSRDPIDNDDLTRWEVYMNRLYDRFSAHGDGLRAWQVLYLAVPDISEDVRAEWANLRNLRLRMEA